MKQPCPFFQTFFRNALHHKQHTYHIHERRRLAHSHRTMRQSGFTLLELLIALTLMLVVVVAVQRYVAGVMSDQKHLSAQQDQTSQMFIVLGNIQNDVAKAGFTPLASETTAEPKLSVQIRACSSKTKGACQNNTELAIHYWVMGEGVNVHDCLGDIVTNRTGKWAEVENIYRVKDTGELACSGNGGTSARTEALLNDVVSFNWQLSAKDASSGAQILSVCFTAQLDATQSVVKTGEAKNCVTGETWTPPAGSTGFYQTTRMDLWVRPQAIPLAAVPQESAK